MKATKYVLQFGFGIRDINVVRDEEKSDRAWVAYQDGTFQGAGKDLDGCLAAVRARLRGEHDKRVAAAIKVLGEMEATRAKIDAETEPPKETA